MASRRITTLTGRLQVLRRIARRFVGWRFELDELINQMWLSPWVRSAEQEHHLVRAGRNAMYDYLRTELNRKAAPSPKTTCEDILNDTWMDFDSMSKGWTFAQRVIVKLRADWFTWPEVAKLTGFSPSNARYQLSITGQSRIKDWAAI